MEVSSGERQSTDNDVGETGDGPEEDRVMLGEMKEALEAILNGSMLRTVGVVVSHFSVSISEWQLLVIS